MDVETLAKELRKAFKFGTGMKWEELATSERMNWIRVARRALELLTEEPAK